MNTTIDDHRATICALLFLLFGAGISGDGTLMLGSSHAGSDDPQISIQSTVTETWNAVKQFSLASNPNGAWSYGYANVAGGAFTRLAFPSKPCTATNTTGLKCWTDDGSNPNFAGVFGNYSGSTVDYLTIVMPPNVLWLAIQANEVVTRWTAPSAGEYSVAGSFTGIDTGQAPVSVGVYLNGSKPLAQAGTLDIGRENSGSAVREPALQALRDVEVDIYFRQLLDPGRRLSATRAFNHTKTCLPRY